MAYRCVKSILLACTAVGGLLAVTADANAGAFGLREQSSYGQGSSFAGIAAGGDLSSMFWNPATMTQMPGLQTEMVATGILPYAANTPGAGSTLAILGGTDNVANSALVPSGYASWQINPNMWVGLSFNSPFGLSVSFPDIWAGRDYGEGSSLKSYNATPSFAYRFNDWLSVGAGVQIQYAKADVMFGLPTGLGQQLSLSGDGWGYGFTAGITLTPMPNMTIGLGYRSAINQKINGTLSLPAGFLFNPPFSTPGSISTTLDLPDTVSLGIRYQFAPRWTALGTVEWSNWSRIGTSNIVQSNGAPATVVLNNVALPFQYQDGWLYSIGAEYQWSERLALRGGVGFERSPITDQVRMPTLPDNDRTWLSAGATYHISKDLSFDLAYSHLFVKSTSINISAASGNPWFIPGIPINYIGDVSSHIDILSIALKYRWDDAAPAPQKMLYTK